MGITLFKRKLKNGRTSLYVNYSKNGKRRKESLGIILEVPKDKAIRESNNEKLRIAKCIVLQRELSYLQSSYKTYLPSVLQKENLEENSEVLFNINLLETFNEYIAQYSNKDIRLVKAANAQLREYTHSDILLPVQVTSSFCLGFQKFLNSKYKGNTPSHYFKKFKMFLGYCLEKSLIEINPASNIHTSQHNAITKNILTPEEISKLAYTACKSPELKRAFLFACYSGLRWSDVVNLKMSDIDYKSRILTITQQKVSKSSSCAVLHLYLCNSAVRLLNKNSQTQHGEENVFSLPSHAYALKILKDWISEAGIRKHITFHCARHTFVTLLISNGVDIKTVSSLAGHSTTRHTETYMHIIDKNKKKAIDSMPELPDYIL